MIKASFGIKHEPFQRTDLKLLSQQQRIFDIIQTHSQHGGLSVITGNPGVGKSVLREHIENLQNDRDKVVISFSRTMHTYHNIIKQIQESLKIDAPNKTIEKEIIKSAYHFVRERKTIFTLIDEAHLLDMANLRKLRLLFDQFPKKHNLVLFGQRELLYDLSLTVNEDIKSRITYSENIQPLNDIDLENYIKSELEAVRLGENVFDTGAIELIIRQARGNLRLCRNLSYGSLIEACRDSKRNVAISHVNAVLVQPHWRNHDELVKQQAK